MSKPDQLFIGGIPAGLTEKQLRAACDATGVIGDLHLEADPNTLGNARFALVQVHPDVQGYPEQLAIDGHHLTVCPAPALSLMETPTFRTFLRFIGARPFTASAALWDQLTELAEDGHVWITKIDDVIFEREHLGRRMEGNQVLTMGPLEGNQEWHIAQFGPRKLVTIEAYRPNVLKCRAMLTAFPDLSIEVIESDVLSVELQPEFEVIFCLGLLYHLLDPHLLLDKIKRLEPTWLLVGTQLATKPDHPSFASRQLLEESTVDLNGTAYSGRLFPDERSSDQEYKTGVDQRASFWFYPHELRRIFRDQGYHEELWAVQDRGIAGVTLHAILANASKIGSEAWEDATKDND